MNYTGYIYVFRICAFTHTQVVTINFKKGVGVCEGLIGGKEKGREVIILKSQKTKNLKIA